MRREPSRVTVAKGEKKSARAGARRQQHCVELRRGGKESARGKQARRGGSQPATRASHQGSLFPNLASGVFDSSVGHASAIIHEDTMLSPYLGSPSGALASLAQPHRGRLAERRAGCSSTMARALRSRAG